MATREGEGRWPAQCEPLYLDPHVLPVPAPEKPKKPDVPLLPNEVDSDYLR